MWLSFHPVAISSSFQIFPKSSYCMPEVMYGSALSASGGVLSGPAAFPDFSFLVALTISSLDYLLQFTSSSDGALGIDGVSVGDGLLSSSLKCSTHCCNWLSFLVKMFPSLSFTWLLIATSVFPH